ncbi:MAG: SDR family oxidoreductase [Phenylobacterium sp.]|uniref:SDR family oxidoreductase n=1 Tax=Phenylobacterium sp. TaxID=1871053 RepID=UPI0025F5F843|nr:SDR family oxidoreductase [Phenylobacterium sp.]MCA6227523.1 SDR family oxidoreductase [Phenylobacterium sp.]MCA6231784.1 SDR family oxidoreductase [Phenylobacterium sp.]MCA6235347.1 SDR family oxidoreductase [Phenylobacterium sp.]MCA6249629.1 SDR family oxidoreductase [Phenylobacterium sp.]MCA6252507.1 SDR family oxidoreductase [Phenylobacterium sp.]
MRCRFEGRTAFVSGGASGIGAETVAALVGEGARVGFGDRDSAKGEAFARETGAAFFPLDVRDEAAWRLAIAQTEQRFGPVSIIVNSAGISQPASIEQASLEHWRETMAINADGCFLGCKVGVEALKRAGGGAIVNVASMLGARGGATFPAYSASKGAVRYLTRSVALHCAQAGLNIRANCVLPGAIDTPMYRSYIDRAVQAGATQDAAERQFAAMHPMGRVGKASEVAAAILFLASDEGSFITGADLPVEGGALA